MNIPEKIGQVGAFLRESSSPAPFILDLLRLKSTDYLGECRGIKFELRAGTFEWFTVLENIVREDYFDGGITIPEGATIVDIGANFGSFSILAAKKAGATGRVIAFEPSSLIFNRLRKNIELNGANNIEPFEEAISDFDGFLDLHMHKRSAFSTLVSSVDERSNDGAEIVRVKTRSINNLLAGIAREIDLLKIDCEGSEYAILASLDPVLASKVRQVSMEVHNVNGHDPSEIGQMLRGLGFTVTEALPKVTAIRESCPPPSSRTTRWQMP